MVSHIVTLKGINISLNTKAGVFSKQGLDAGTELMLNEVKIKEHTQIADLGCGSGVVGIFAAKLNPNGHVHLLDDHLRSINLAKENVEANNCQNAEVYLSDLFSAVADRTYHQVLSNPPAQMGKEFLAEIVEESYKHLKPNGELWVVIVNNLRPVIERSMEDKFGNVKALKKGQQHTVLLSYKKA